MLIFIALLLAGCGTTANVAGYEPLKGSDTNVKLGIEYMRLGRTDIALTKLQRAVEIDPRNAEAHNIIALVYEQVGKAELAREHFEQAVFLDPANASAHINYGNFLCRRQQIQEAETHFLLTVENPMYTTPEVAYTNAGICLLKSGDRVKAETYLEKALTYNKKFSNALYQMATLYYEKNWHREARGYLDRYLENAEHTPQSLWLGILIAQALDDKDTEASYALLLKGKFPDAEETRLMKERGIW